MFRLLILLLLIGCTTGPEHPLPRSRVVELVPEFPTEDISVTLTGLNPDWSAFLVKLWYWDQHTRIDGMCNILTKSIYLDREIWATSSEAERRVTLLHELGHCLFNRLFHTSGDLQDDGCVNSLMSIDVVDEVCYIRHEAYYLDELQFPEKYGN